ncbi:membrane protein insertase YidC [Faunimonas sp. B44]|uniref:membrane protein insertase YidC n=1 Tax=Faunimonas sp. B44 TaxID=3461493 RepID=UPI00404438B8
MTNNRNTLVAIALSIAVLLAWQYFVTGPKMEAERQRQIAEQQQAVEPAPGIVPQTAAPGQAPGAPATPATPAPGAAPVPAPTAQPSPASPGAPGGIITRDQAIASGQRVRIDTPSLAGSINLVGGRLDDLLLKKYRVTVDRNSPNVELLSPVGTEHPYYAEFGWVTAQGGPAVPTADSVWQADRTAIAPGEDVTLTWDNGAGLVFRRTFSVDQDYMFTVRQSVENASGADVTLYPYGLVNRTGKPATAGFYILHEGLIGVFGDKGLQEVDYDDLDDEGTITPIQTSDGWLGITDKYWATTLVPRGDGQFQGRFLRAGTGAQPTYQADFLADPVAVPAGGSASSETLLFAGAKQVDLIDRYEAQLGVERFELLIDWGWFYFLTKPMFVAIDWLFRMLGNFGLAILAVTVIVKLIFLPLANRSYKSMSVMKKLQPEMQKIQERYKDDRMAMQQAMMELYKKEKVNPVAGCWPILIQIPVFFALYKVLFVTIEMRHAPFFGWIHDLSAPDPTNLFNLFGLIPWDPPQFLHLGIWPIIMGVTMFIQMRMNPTPPDKTQAMIFNWMPFIFTFMLATFPAGLVIYWAWNNTLSVIQQGYIMKRNGVRIELWDNLKGLFVRKPKDSPAE